MPDQPGILVHRFEPIQGHSQGEDADSICLVAGVVDQFGFHELAMDNGQISIMDQGGPFNPLDQKIPIVGSPPQLRRGYPMIIKEDGSPLNALDAFQQSIASGIVIDRKVRQVKMPLLSADQIPQGENPAKDRDILGDILWGMPDEDAHLVPPTAEEPSHVDDTGANGVLG